MSPPFPFHCRAESRCPCSLAVHWGSSFSSLDLGYSELPAGSSKVLNSKRLPLLRGARCSPTWQRRGEECPATVPGVAFVPNQAGGPRLCPAPAFVPQQFSVYPSAGHAPTRPSLWTLTSYLRKGGFDLESGKASSRVGGEGVGVEVGWGWGLPVEIFAEYFHGPMDCWGRTHQGRVPVNQACLNPGSRL